MAQEKEYLLTFKNTNIAIQAEQALLAEKVLVSVVPLPSQISAGCGICLKVSRASVLQTLTVLEKEFPPEYYTLYARQNGDGRCTYTPIHDRSSLMQANLTSLLDNCTSGGCGAKISPGELSALLANLPRQEDSRLIVGFDSSDDAAVYQLDETSSLVSTVDFFPPMVNDPRTFGRIAAANALSDVYAMGGRPLTALNLVCFPSTLDTAVLGEILAGGAEKVQEASAVLAGGHSIYDKEPKYGLAVTGIVKNDELLRNDTPAVGHHLILTKPLGVGIIMAAHRGGVASEAAVNAAVASMQRLNRYAAEQLHGFDVSACTDVTGFGLLAHLLEMASERVSIRLHPSEIPYISEARAYAEEFLLTAAGQRNRNHLAGKAEVDALPFALQELLFDPQTSGGLLISVAPEQSSDLLQAIQAKDPAARLIGEVIPREHAVIVL